MNALKYGFGLILVGGFALTASCGGSSGDSSSTGGTSSSTGGTSSSTGGTFGNPTGGTVGNPSGGTVGNPSGGTSNPSGGTGNPNGGTGNPNGGTGNPAGGNGAGGATMNPAGCPATAPAIPAMGMPGAACMALATPQTRCTYPVMGNMTETCTCRVPFNGGGQAGAPSTDGTWRCNVGATPIMCSATPTTGEACTGGGCALPNMGGFCRCRNGMLQCPGGVGAAGAGG